MNGFLGARGSFMLDVVVASMVVAVPLLGLSICLAHFAAKYAIHRRIQLLLGIILLIAVLAFELEMRLYGWRSRAEASSFWRDGTWNDWVDYSLAIHLLFAVPTPLLWLWVLWRALRRFPNPPEPGSHSREHRLWGWLAVYSLILTAITGYGFYWCAFVA
ncbi:MAG TPA: DUF420 domain-containing protein [Pirellulaceae bacterium]